VGQRFLHIVQSACDLVHTDDNFLQNRLTFDFSQRSTRAGKPRSRDRRSPAEKVEHLLFMSLDRIHDYLAWPPAELDPRRLTAQPQVPSAPWCS